MKAPSPVDRGILRGILEVVEGPKEEVPPHGKDDYAHDLPYSTHGGCSGCLGLIRWLREDAVVEEIEGCIIL